MRKNYYFISDVHLGLQSKEKEAVKERTLVKLLECMIEDAKELYILGDLFDYWFEYNRVYQKGFFRTLTALQDLSESGVNIHYIIGNHDFSHRDFFVQEIGAKVYENPIEVTLDDKKFYLAHGDGLVSNDIGYLILKKVLRNKAVQRFYSMLHPDLGIALARNVSKSSREHTSQKDYGEMDGMFEAAKKKIDSGFDYIIFGHSHRRAFEKYNHGYYINLGSWLKEPGYGCFYNNEFKILDWKNNV